MNTSKTDDIRSFIDWAPKGRSTWGAYALGIVVLAIMFALGPAIVALLLLPLFGSYEELPPLKKLIFEDSAFLPLLLTPLILAWALHKRPWWSIVVPRPRVEWWNFGMGFLFSLLALLGDWIFNTLLWGIKITTVPLDLREYLPFAMAALIFVFIQTTAEELVFRGYLMQTLRRMTANPTFIIVLTGVLFASTHLGNLGSLGWPWYGAFTWVIDGCMFAWLAYRTRSLWMPIGWHWANNFTLIAVLSVKTDVVEGVSLFSAASYPSIELVLLNKIILFTVLILIINRVVSGREKAGGQ